MNAKMEWNEMLIKYANHKVMSPTDYDNRLEQISAKFYKNLSRLLKYSLIFGVLCVLYFVTVFSFDLRENMSLFWVLLILGFVSVVPVALTLVAMIGNSPTSFTLWQGELGPIALESLATQIEESESVELAAIVKCWLDQHGILRQAEKDMVQVACEVHRTTESQPSNTKGELRVNIRTKQLWKSGIELFLCFCGATALAWLAYSMYYSAGNEVYGTLEKIFQALAVVAVFVLGVSVIGLPLLGLVFDWNRYHRVQEEKQK